MSTGDISEAKKEANDAANNEYNAVYKQMMQPNQVMNITGAAARLAGGVATLAILGQGAAIDLLPWGQKGAPGTGASFGHAIYEINQTGPKSQFAFLSTNNNPVEGEAANQHLEYLLPASTQVASQLGGPDSIYNQPILSNNFAPGFRAYFGNTIAATPVLSSGKYDLSTGIPFFGPNSMLWGAGIQGGPNNTATALSTEDRPETYWGIDSININSLLGAPYRGTLNSPDNGLFMFSGKENDRAGMFFWDQSWNPKLQGAQLTGSVNGNGTINTPVLVNNSMKIFATQGSLFYSTTGLAFFSKDKGTSASPNSATFGFSPAPQSPYVFIEKNLGSGLAHIADIVVPNNGMSSPDQLNVSFGPAFQGTLKFSTSTPFDVIPLAEAYAPTPDGGYKSQNHINAEFVSVVGAKDRQSVTIGGNGLPIKEEDSNGSPVTSEYRGVNGEKALLSIEAQGGVPAIISASMIKFMNGVPVNIDLGIDQISFEGNNYWQPAKAYVDSSNKLILTSGQSMPRFEPIIQIGNPTVLDFSNNPIKSGATSGQWTNPFDFLLINPSKTSTGESSNIPAKSSFMPGQWTNPFDSYLNNSSTSSSGVNPEYTVVVAGDGKTATGQRLDINLGGNFSGNMSLDLRNLNYVTSNPLSNFAVLTDANSQEFKPIGTMATLNGGKVIFNGRGIMASATKGEQFVETSDSKQPLAFNYHILYGSGNWADEKIAYDKLSFMGEGEYVKGFSVTDFTPTNNKIQYTIGLDNTIRETPFTWNINKEEGSLKFETIGNLPLLSVGIVAPSDVLKAYPTKDNPNSQSATKSDNGKGTGAKFASVAEQLQATYSDYHKVPVTIEGQIPVGENQNLILNLISPSYATLSQDANKLALMNNTGGELNFGNIVDQTGRQTSFMSSDNGAIDYFEKQGQLPHFTGINHITNVDNQGQLATGMFLDITKHLVVQGIRFDTMALQEVQGSDGEIHLQALSQGTSLHSINPWGNPVYAYEGTSDGISYLPTGYFNSFRIIKDGKIELMNIDKASYVPANVGTISSSPSNVVAASQKVIASQTESSAAKTNKVIVINPLAEVPTSDTIHIKPSDLALLLGRSNSAADTGASDKNLNTDSTVAADAMYKASYLLEKKPNAHTVTLLSGGMEAANQSLFLTLQTPLSGVLSQDQENLVLISPEGKSVLANVVDQNSKITGNLSMNKGEAAYFNNEGQLNYVTGKFDFNNTDGNGQFTSFLFKDSKQNPHVGAMWVKNLTLGHSIGEDGKIKLDVFQLDRFNNIYVDSDGNVVNRATINATDILKGNVRIKLVGDTTFVPIYLVNLMGNAANEQAQDKEKSDRFAFFTQTGDVGKSKISQLGPNGDKILYEFLKDGIVKNISDKEVHIESNLAAKESLVRQIVKEAGGDNVEADKILAFLYQFQGHPEAKNLNPLQLEKLYQDYMSHLPPPADTLFSTIVKEVNSDSKYANLSPEQRLEISNEIYYNSTRNQPQYHAEDLLGNGMGRNQWLIATFQTPFGGYLSHDSSKLILNNTTHDVLLFGNVYTQSDQGNQARIYTNDEYISGGSKVYFNEQGQIEHFNGNLSVIPTKNSPLPYQYNNLTSKDIWGNVEVSTFLTKQLVLTHSMDTEGNVHLNMVFSRNYDPSDTIFPDNNFLINQVTHKSIQFTPPPFLSSSDSAGSITNWILNHQGNLYFSNGRADGEHYYAVMTGPFEGQLQREEPLRNSVVDAISEFPIEILSNTLGFRQIYNNDIKNGDYALADMHKMEWEWMHDTIDGSIHGQNSMSSMEGLRESSWVYDPYRPWPNEALISNVANIMMGVGTIPISIAKGVTRFSRTAAIAALYLLLPTSEEIPDKYLARYKDWKQGFYDKVYSYGYKSGWGNDWNKIDKNAPWYQFGGWEFEKQNLKDAAITVAVLMPFAHSTATASSASLLEKFVQLGIKPGSVRYAIALFTTRFAASATLTWGVPNAISWGLGNGWIGGSPLSGPNTTLLLAALSYPVAKQISMIGINAEGASTLSLFYRIPQSAVTTGLLWGQINAAWFAANSAYNGHNNYITTGNLVNEYLQGAHYGFWFGGVAGIAGGILGSPRLLALARTSPVKAALIKYGLVGVLGAGANVLAHYTSGEKDHLWADAFTGAAIGVFALSSFRNVELLKKYSPWIRYPVAAALGAAGRVGYRWIAEGNKYFSDTNRVESDILVGIGLGLLGMKYMTGLKDMGTVASAESRFAEKMLAKNLLTISAEGALKWTYVSPAFTVGNALWHGRLGDINIGKRDQYDLLQSSINGPLSGRWMNVVFNALQVKGGTPDKGSYGELLRGIQKGPLADAMGQHLWSNVVYMPGLMTGTDSAVDLINSMLPALVIGNMTKEFVSFGVMTTLPAYGTLGMKEFEEGTNLMREGKYVDADKKFDQAKQLDPKNPQFILAQIDNLRLFIAGNSTVTDATIGALNHIIGLREEAASLYKANGDIQGLESLDKLVDRIQAGFYAKNGQELYSSGKYAEAFVSWGKAGEFDPGNGIHDLYQAAALIDMQRRGIPNAGKPVDPESINQLLRVARGKLGIISDNGTLNSIEAHWLALQAGKHSAEGNYGKAYELYWRAAEKLPGEWRYKVNALLNALRILERVEKGENIKLPEGIPSLSGLEIGKLLGEALNMAQKPSSQDVHGASDAELQNIRKAKNAVDAKYPPPVTVSPKPGSAPEVLQEAPTAYKPEAPNPAPEAGKGPKTFAANDSDVTYGAVKGARDQIERRVAHTSEPEAFGRGHRIVYRDANLNEVGIRIELGNIIREEWIDPNLTLGGGGVGLIRRGTAEDGPDKGKLIITVVHNPKVGTRTHEIEEAFALKSQETALNGKINLEAKGTQQWADRLLSTSSHKYAEEYLAAPSPVERIEGETQGDLEIPYSQGPPSEIDLLRRPIAFAASDQAVQDNQPEITPKEKISSEENEEIEPQLGLTPAELKLLERKKRLREALGTAGRVVVFDGVGWTGPKISSFFESVAERAPVWICTRSEHPWDIGHFWPLLARFARVEVHPFSLSETQALVVAAVRAGGIPPRAQEIVGWLQRRSGGVPLVLRELLEEVATGKYDLASPSALRRLDLDRRIHEVFPL